MLTIDEEGFGGRPVVCPHCLFARRTPELPPADLRAQVRLFLLASGRQISSKPRVCLHQLYHPRGLLSARVVGAGLCLSRVG